MPMRPPILDRYSRSEGGEVLIEVSARRPGDLYNRFDRTSPPRRRDLDPKLVDYLVECARELEHTPAGILIHLDQVPDESTRGRIERSFANFFLYLVELERRKVRSMFRTSAVLFALGVVILWFAEGFGDAVADSGGLLGSVATEGLTVAAWVALWEALAVFCVQWFPLRRNVRLLRGLAEMRIDFSADPVD